MKSKTHLFKVLPNAKGNQVVSPVSVCEGGGPELSEDRCCVSGCCGGGEGGALDLRHVGHDVVGGGAHHGDALVSVLHLVKEINFKGKMHLRYSLHTLK